MKLAIISFTENGIKLSKTVSKSLSGRKVTLYTKCSRYTAEDLKVQRVKESLQVWTAQRMAEGDALLFIGACGIAVRAIAPNLTDKLHDVPVLVMDEEGQYVIPILSGHVGGANELARELADLIDARPVITTATDVQKKFAVDLFAKRNHLEIMNKDGIAKVSAKALAGEQLTIAIRAKNIECYHPKFCEVCEEDFTEAENQLLREASMHKQDQEACGVEPPLRLVPYVKDQPVDIVVSEMQDNKNALIWLRPRRYVVGMGCRKNKDPEELFDFYMKTLEKAMVEPGEVYALASIDKKKDEPGLLAISERMRIPFFTYTAEELNRVGACVHSSEFVKAQVGVDNVCERSAVLGSDNGKLLIKKSGGNGVTTALAIRKWEVRFE